MITSKTLLVIDDEEDLRDIVEYKFKSQGYNVITALDGLDGLEKLKTVSPDLIILDMNMPRMNGLEFYEKITGKEEKPKYPVLVLTARANMEQLFRDMDVDGFMPKPFDIEQLYKEGEAIIKKYSGSIKGVAGSGEMRARKVCIVENDQKIFSGLAVAFLESGYIVNSAQSGASAIKRIRMDIPDAVVISLGLSDISGDVAVLKLKKLEETKDVKYILYTARSGEKAQVTQKIAEKYGVEQFVEYSTPQDILEAVDKVFRK